MAIGALLVILVNVVAFRKDADFQIMRNDLRALAVEPALAPSDHRRCYRGVMHVHSNLSHDSGGDPDEIAKAAKAAGLDFVMMTDHNSPEIFQNGVAGWHDGVLVIRGAEIRAENDYLLALGVNSYINPNGLTFHEVATAVAAQGGVAIGAHPNRFKHWDEPALTGVEVWDLYDEILSDPWRYPDLVVDALLSYEDYLDDTLIHGVRPTDSEPVAFDAEMLVSLVRHPERALAAFDTETLHRRFTALGTPDAHKKNIQFLNRLDMYSLLLPFVTTHLFADQATPDALLDALRRGHAYMAFDLEAPAQTFDFRAVDSDGNIWRMGDETVWTPGLTLQVSAPHAGRMTLVRNGAAISQIDATATAIPVEGSGVYRVEVAILVKGRWQPWIYSNPIYIR